MYMQDNSENGGEQKPHGSLDKTLLSDYAILENLAIESSLFFTELQFFT